MKLNIKKIIALLTVMTLIFVMVAACNNEPATPATSPEPSPDTTVTTPEPADEDEDEDEELPDNEPFSFGGKNFVIFSWDPGYATLDPDPAIEDPDYDGQGWDNIQRIWNDMQGSVSYELAAYDEIYALLVASVLAGQPLGDIVHVPAANIASAVVNNIIMPLEDVVPANDLFWTGDDWLFPARELNGKHFFINTKDNIYGVTLSYNKNIIQAAGLEDPGAIYDRGGWTWDVFLEYLQELTTLGPDGVPNQFGLSGRGDMILKMMLASNDAAMIDSSSFEFAVDSPNGMRAFDFYNQIFINERLNKTLTGDDGADQFAYDEGDVAFWATEQWYIWAAGNLFWDEEIAIGGVPFPRGPDNRSGTSHFMLPDSGTAIPVGAEDPYGSYRMRYEMYMTFRYFSDEAFESETGEATIEQLLKAAMDYIYFLWGDTARDAERVAYDWNNHGIFDFGMHMEVLTPEEVFEFTSGEMTAAQFIEEIRPVVNDQLSELFG